MNVKRRFRTPQFLHAAGTLHRGLGIFYPSVKVQPPYPVAVIISHTFFHGRTVVSTGIPKFFSDRGWATLFLTNMDKYFLSSDPRVVKQLVQEQFAMRWAALRKYIDCTDEKLWFGYDAGATVASYMARKNDSDTAGVISYSGWYPINCEKVNVRNKFPVLIMHSQRDRLVRDADLRDEYLQWILRGHPTRLDNTLPGGHSFRYESAIPIISSWIDAHDLRRR